MVFLPPLLMAPCPRTVTPWRGIPLGSARSRAHEHNFCKGAQRKTILQKNLEKLLRTGLSASPYGVKRVGCCLPWECQKIKRKEIPAYGSFCRMNKPTKSLESMSFFSSAFPSFAAGRLVEPPRQKNHNITISQYHTRQSRHGNSYDL